MKTINISSTMEGFSTNPFITDLIKRANVFLESVTDFDIENIRKLSEIEYHEHKDRYEQSPFPIKISSNLIIAGDGSSNAVLKILFDLAIKRKYSSALIEVDCDENKVSWDIRFGDDGDYTEYLLSI